MDNGAVSQAQPWTSPPLALKADKSNNTEWLCAVLTSFGPKRNQKMFCFLSLDLPFPPQVLWSSKMCGPSSSPKISLLWLVNGHFWVTVGMVGHSLTLRRVNISWKIKELSNYGFLSVLIFHFSTAYKTAQKAIWLKVTFDFPGFFCFELSTKSRR